ncbi:Protein of unknown function [Gryllus bimaculatus]|nr:Protein of unknown function [Gryllus bimaculatus]
MYPLNIHVTSNDCPMFLFAVLLLTLVDLSQQGCQTFHVFPRELLRSFGPHHTTRFEQRPHGDPKTPPALFRSHGNFRTWPLRQRRPPRLDQSSRTVGGRDGKANLKSKFV